MLRTLITVFIQNRRGTMVLIDMLFKKDHTGRRIPTVWVWTLVIVVVFSGYFFSKGDDKLKREILEEQNQEDPVIQTIDVQLDEDSQQDNLFDSFLTSALKKKEHYRTSNPKDRSVHITVYDNTEEYSKEKLPLGSMVECLLIHNIITNNFSSPVIIQVAEDFYFDGNLLLPKDTRIFGEARAGRERDRVLVAFKTIVFQDGTEVKVQARGLDHDGSGGLKAIIINKKTKAKVFTKVMNFLGGTLLGLQEKATNTVTGTNQIALNSRNAILEGGAKMFDEEAKRLLEQIKNAKGYGIVTAGSRLIVYFDESVELALSE